MYSFSFAFLFSFIFRIKSTRHSDHLRWFKIVSDGSSWTSLGVCVGDNESTYSEVVSSKLDSAIKNKLDCVELVLYESTSICMSFVRVEVQVEERACSMRERVCFSFKFNFSFSLSYSLNSFDISRFKDFVRLANKNQIRNWKKIQLWSESVQFYLNLPHR